VLKTETGSARIDIPAPALYALLTDYDSYSEWVPEITYSRTLAKEGDIVIAEFKAPRYSSGKLVMELIHSPPESVMFSQTDRYRERGLSGRWDLTEAEGGGAVTLQGRMSVKTDFYDFSSRKKTRNALAGLLAAIAERARQPGPDESPKKILTVVKRGQDLRVWLQGETFELIKRTTGEAK
jgi:ribosome-associated toxin RatA of RatAB toxin-antitoxin module